MAHLTSTVRRDKLRKMIRALLFLSITLPVFAQPLIPFTAQAPPFPSSTAFRQVAVADINSDGNPDLVFTDGNGYSIWVMLGDGTGKFTEAPNSRFHAGNGPMTVVAADFNNDGKLDLAVLNHFTEPLTFFRSSYAIFFGNGAGGFTPGPIQLTSAIADSMITGDFNNDGIPDLAFAGTDGVSLLLGSGDGVFRAAGLPFGRAAVFLLSGDFNNDGFLDLAVSDSNASPLSIYLGTGTGQFLKPSAASPVPRNSFAAGVAGDWNHDGLPDLAILGSGKLTTLLGDGKGSFRTVATLPAENSTLLPQSVADFDSDGNLDLLIMGPNYALILAGDGTGNFRGAQYVPMSTPSSYAFAADVNHDGKPDVIAFNGQVKLNSLKTLPVSPATLKFHAYAGQTSVPPIAVGTGSLAPLAVTSDQPWVQYISGQVTVDPSTLFPGIHQAKLRFTAPGYFGREVSISLDIAAPSGTLTKRSAIALDHASSNIKEIQLADFNADGKPDLLLQSYPQLSIRLNDGAGTFQAPVTFPVAAGTQAVADFDGDGKLDVVILSTRGIFLYSGDGAGNLRPGRLASSGDPVYAFSVKVADFNLDGFPDLVIGSSGDTPIQLFLNDGHSNFREVKAPVPGSRLDYGGYIFQIADYNGDGFPDLAFASDRGQAIYIALGDGTGHFETVQTVVLSPDDRGITLVSGDWNHDGIIDLAAVSSAVSMGNKLPNGTLAVMLGNDDGLFRVTRRPLLSVTASESLIAADFDGDGNPDLAIATDGITTTLLFGDGTGAFLPRAGYLLPESYGSLTADLNGDGRADLVVRQLDGLAVYLGESAQVLLELTQQQANPFTIGQAVAFDATLTYAPAFSVPTGTVLLFDGMLLAGSLPIAAGPTGSTLHFTTPFATGTHQFRAVYDGDSRFAPATASLASIEVGPPASLTTSSNSLPLRALVTDSKGSPVGGAGVIFNAPAFGPSGTFNGLLFANALTDRNGIATAPLFTPGAVPGALSVTATVSGYPNLTAVFQLVN